MQEDWKDQLAEATGHHAETKHYSASEKGGQKMEKRYFHEDEHRGKIREELLDGKAKEWAKSFINPGRSGRQFNPKLTASQIRRFHNDARELEARVEEEGFEKMKPIIKMMKSKVAYACPSEGGQRKVPLEFRKYIEEMVDNIHDKEDFRAFSLCFEAVVGYFFGEGGR